MGAPTGSNENGLGDAGRSKTQAPLHNPQSCCAYADDTPLTQTAGERCRFVTIPVGVPFRPAHQHEPLLLALLLPAIRRRDWRRPWVFRGSHYTSKTAGRLEKGWKVQIGRQPAGSTGCDESDGKLSQVQEDVSAWSGNVLHKFLGTTRSIPSMLEGVVREMLSLPPLGPVPHQHRGT